MKHPKAPRPVTVFPAADDGSGVRHSASLKGGSWRSLQAEMPPPGVFLSGPFDTAPSSGTSVGTALAAYLCTHCQSSNRKFYTGTDPHR